MNPAARHALLAALLSAALCHAAAAQVRVDFPLQGYYRPGKYMPVRLTIGAKPPAPVVLRADGTVAVSVAPGAGAMNTVVPWLAAGVVRSPRWEIAGAGGGAIESPLTPVEPHQLLVGVVGTDTSAAAAAAAELFPDRPVIAVALTGATAMPGDPMAWEALDLAVFDDANHVHLAELLGQGVSVVIRSDARPGGRWAWQGGPGHWFVRFDAAGPVGAVHPEVYAAVGAWRPGWPAPTRRRAALLAAVYCLVALGATLWRRTWRATTGVAAASAIAAVGFAWWASRQPMVRRVDTRVECVGTTTGQADRWAYYRPLRRREVTIDWPWSTRPVFASARHLGMTDIRLHVDDAGRPLGFTWRAEPGTTLAFLGRRFDHFTGATGLPAPLPPPPPSPSPTRELVLQAYLTPGDVILDDPASVLPDDDADWSVSWPPVTVRHGEG